MERKRRRTRPRVSFLCAIRSDLLLVLLIHLQLLEEVVVLQDSTKISYAAAFSAPLKSDFGPSETLVVSTDRSVPLFPNAFSSHSLTSLSTRRTSPTAPTIRETPFFSFRWQIDFPALQSSSERHRHTNCSGTIRRRGNGDKEANIPVEKKCCETSL